MSGVVGGKEGERVSVFEQHAQTILASLIILLVGGTAGVLFAMREDVAVLKRDVQYMSESLKNAGDDRFRGADWRRESLIIDRNFANHDERLKALEYAHRDGQHRLLPPQGK